MIQRHRASGKTSLCLIITIALSITVIKGDSATVKTLSSPQLTHWGNWGPWAMCYLGYYVVKVNLRVEGSQGRGDDTGLNAIRLLCRSLDGKHEYELKSAEGEWGDWNGWESCGNDAVATGFKLRSEPRQGDGDDVAAADFKLLCSSPDSKYETYGSNLLDWGYWTGEQRCPPGFAVCGIQTQVEPSIGKGDDTSLNNVNIGCCKIQHPTSTCIPSYHWIFEATCHRGQDCKAIYTAKISYNGVRTGNVASQQFYEKLGSGLEINKAYSELRTKFQNSYSKIIDTEIEDLINYDINTAFRVETTFLDCDTAIESLVLKCGIYSIKTKEHRCRP